MKFLKILNGYENIDKNIFSSMSKTIVLYQLTSPQSLLGVVVCCSSALQSLRASKVNEVELGSQSLKVSEHLCCVSFLPIVWHLGANREETESQSLMFN